VLGGETVKCWRAVSAEGGAAPGQILAVGDAGVTVACGTGALRLTELQRPGGRRLAAREFLHGHAWRAGMRFDVTAD
jgi:methionyl-tRNA formyltransferase